MANSLFVKSFNVTIFIIVAIVIIFFLIQSLNIGEGFYNKFGNNLYNIHKETDIKNGYIGVHPNIFKKTKHRDYYITYRYNFNLTTDEREELMKIVNPIIKKINQDLKLEFHFIDFEHITTQVFNDNTKRFIIDFNLHETNKYYDKRLIADVILFTKKKSIKVNNLSIGNGNIQKTSDKIAIPEFSPKIISDKNLKISNIVIGNEESNLEYNILKKDKQKFINNDNKKNFTKWLLPNNNESSKSEEWPCRKQWGKWDENGILETEECSKNCKGINSSYSSQLKKPNFIPSFKIIEQDNQHNWLWGESKGTGTNMFSGGRGHGGM